MPYKQHPDLENFSNNIKQLRKTHGLSKKEMASIMGIGVGSLTKLEQGILPPKATVQILLNLHEHFGISISDLFQNHTLPF